MITVIARTLEQRNKLYAIADANENLEFAIASQFEPYYLYGLINDAKRRGHDANMAVPTGTLEAWAGYIEFDEFENRQKRFEKQC